ncbi:uncharacterized protein LOC144598479 [Rhinoraja longicauda]
MWEARNAAGASGCYNCGKCVQVQLLKRRVGELESQLDDASSPSGGQVGSSNPGKETRPGRPKSGRAMVVGDSIVRGTDSRFCGGRRDLRMVCCLPGARVQDITGRLHNILAREGDQPEVVVHVGTTDVGRKRKEILQRGRHHLPCGNYYGMCRRDGCLPGEITLPYSSCHCCIHAD